MSGSDHVVYNPKLNILIDVQQSTNHTSYSFLYFYKELDGQNKKIK